MPHWELFVTANGERGLLLFLLLLCAPQPFICGWLTHSTALFDGDCCDCSAQDDQKKEMREKIGNGKKKKESFINTNMQSGHEYVNSRKGFA